jgi:hypothetical protein
MTEWDATPNRNLLLAENLDPIRQEVASGSTIFGWHYHYAGGRSGDTFAYTGFQAFYDELIKSHPGDHFTVYCLDRLAHVAMARRNSGEAGSLDPVREALHASQEVVFVWRGGPTGTAAESGVLARWEEVEELCFRNGELVFFLMETLDLDENGVAVSSVSPGARRRVHALADGKRPNDAGYTPPSGVY